jgi:Aspartyl protease
VQYKWVGTTEFQPTGDFTLLEFSPMEYEETITITIVHAVSGKTEALALLSSATLLELAQLSMGLFGLNSSINLMKDGVLLDSSKTLLGAGVKNGDILSAHEFFGLKSDITAASNSSVTQLDFSSLLSGATGSTQSKHKNIGSEPESYFYPGMSLDEAIHHNSHPRSFAKILMENESLFKELNYHHPLLAEKMKNKSLEEITSLWRDEIVKGSIRAAHSYTERAMNEENMRKRLSGNPADVEALQFFKDKESTELINAQYQNVMENYPESMGKILMLYIDATVNGVSIQAFVDSGTSMEFVHT